MYPYLGNLGDEYKYEVSNADLKRYTPLRVRLRLVMKSCQVRNNVINQSMPLRFINEYETIETIDILVITPRFYFYREFWRSLSF